MKKITILGTALGLALLCLVRLDLVAKEPAGQADCRLELPQPRKPLGEPAVTKPKTVARLRRRPALHAQRLPRYFLGRRGRTAQNQPSLAEKRIGPDFGVKAEDIDRITIGSSAWPTHPR